MINPKHFRNEINTIVTGLKKRGITLNVALLEELEAKRKILQTEVQKLQNERNQSSKTIGLAKTQGKNTDTLIKEVSTIGVELASKQKKLAEILQKLNEIYHTTPNLPHATVPEGANEESNLEIRHWGEPKYFNFFPKDHTELGQQLGMMDFPAAAKITGTRFVVLHDKLAKLQRALSQFMLDVQIKEHGYKEVYVPNIVNDTSLFGTGQLPKHHAEIFHLQGNFKYSLIPTAEVPVTNLLRDKIMLEEQLPLKYVTLTPCYRSEAGNYGKDLRGMIRMHQFEKVELVHFTKPQNSYQELEALTQNAEKILQKLELPYRVVALCGGDLGFAAAKTYDLEVWIPSQNKYREISSCSNFEDFQARRMQARWRNTQTGKIELLHTLNGSGLAVGRTLVAILENYQDASGNIQLPKALWKYMDGEQNL